MTHSTLHIDGMSCGHCLNAVNKALASVPGVEIRSLTMGRADIDFDQSRTSLDTIVQSIDQAGYHATAAPSA
jgi:copper chaperone